MDPGPTLPGMPVPLVGAVWILIGVFFLVSVVYWRLFTVGASIMGGAYLTWAVVYTADSFVDFAWGNITSVALYIFLFLVTLTLAQREMDGDRWEDDAE